MPCVDYLALPHAKQAELFFDDFQQHKKIRALKNYSSCETFKDGPQLGLIAKRFSHRFLEWEEKAYLSFLCRSYHVDYLDWCYLTKWVKGEMERRMKRRIARKRKSNLLQIPLPLFDDHTTYLGHTPGIDKKQPVRRRVV